MVAARVLAYGPEYTVELTNHDYIDVSSDKLDSYVYSNKYIIDNLMKGIGYEVKNYCYSSFINTNRLMDVIVHDYENNTLTISIIHSPYIYKHLDITKYTKIWCCSSIPFKTEYDPIISYNPKKINKSAQSIFKK